MNATPLELFKSLISPRRKIAKQCRDAKQHLRNLQEQAEDLEGSGDLIYDAIRDVLEDPVPDLIEYSILKAELALTLADLKLNEEEIAQINAVIDKQNEALGEIRSRMHDLNLENKLYGKILPFRSVANEG